MAVMVEKIATRQIGLCVSASEVYPINFLESAFGGLRWVAAVNLRFSCCPQFLQQRTKAKDSLYLSALALVDPAIRTLVHQLSLAIRFSAAVHQAESVRPGE